MIKLYICCLVLIIGSVEVGPDIDMKFHQEVMEIVSYDINTRILLHCIITACQGHRIQTQAVSDCHDIARCIHSINATHWKRHKIELIRRNSNITIRPQNGSIWPQHGSIRLHPTTININVMT